MVSFRSMGKVEKIQFFISIALKVSIFSLILLSVYRRNLFLIFTSGFVLFLMFLPSIIERSYKINLPTEFDFAVTLILWLHFFLGEFDNFYSVIPWWDLFLHYTSSLLLGLLGFTMAYILLYTGKVKANPWFIALFAVTFSIALGAVWEIFEFSVDHLFGFNMQKSGLVDTMTDLIADSVGATMIGISGYFYVRNPRKGFIDMIIKKILELNAKKE